jgi:hypothetical protein
MKENKGMPQKTFNDRPVMKIEPSDAKKNRGRRPTLADNGEVRGSGAGAGGGGNAEDYDSDRAGGGGDPLPGNSD